MNLWNIRILHMGCGEPLACCPWLQKDCCWWQQHDPKLVLCAGGFGFLPVRYGRETQPTQEPEHGW